MQEIMGFKKLVINNQHKIAGQFLRILCAKWFVKHFLFLRKTEFNKIIVFLQKAYKSLSMLSSLQVKKIGP